MLKHNIIKDNQKWLLKFSEIIKKKSQLCSVVADPTRVKIIFLLTRHHELCVTDIAKILHITLGSASHQLSLLEKSNFTIRKKTGQIVCYCLNNKNNTTQKLVTMLNNENSQKKWNIHTLFKLFGIKI